MSSATFTQSSDEKAASAELVRPLARKARQAAAKLAVLRPDIKNNALIAMADAF